MKMKMKRRPEIAAPTVAEIIRIAKQPDGITPYLLQQRVGSAGLLECFVIVTVLDKFGAIQIERRLYDTMKRVNKAWRVSNTVEI